MNLLSIFEKGHYSKVVEQWDSNQFQVSSDPNAAFIVAASHFRLGSIDKAREICEAIEGPLGNNASFLSMYAAILRRSNLLTRAEEIFIKALEISPDSKEIENNYSNLLIDQGNYERAIELLNKILSQHPSYTDAQNNLNRAKAIKLEKETLKRIPNDNHQTTSTDDFGDPLEQAFNTEEVMRVGGKIGNVTSTIGDILSTNEKSVIEEAELDLLKLAAEQVKTKQYEGALDLLSNLRRRVGFYSPIYKTASDALIGLEKFKEAEIAALTAHINGEKTIANLINLASLAAMRKDQLMAEKWISLAEEIDKNNELVVQCKSLLFPNGSPRENDNPFST